MKTKKIANNSAYSLKKLADLTPDNRNANKGTERGNALIQESLQQYGAGRSILLDKHGAIIAGNKTVENCGAIGLEDVIVVQSDGTKLVAVQRTDLDLKDAKTRQLAIADNRAGQVSLDWDVDVLKELALDGVDLAPFWSADELEKLGLAEAMGDGSGALTLAERFGVPPFSVLDARQGYWQERKRAWLSLGIKSEVGRDAAVGGSKMVAEYKNGKRETSLVANTDSSIFDPVLCELLYRWFTPKEAILLDPFAGGSVRGIVASHLGLQYIGVDLRPEQVEANRQQGRIAKDPQPVWVVGDSRNIQQLAGGIEADMIFSCPPYADLERYSNDPHDLSTMDYPAFLVVYREIIAAACAMLKPNRFACFVVGDIRDKKGFYRGFVADTEQAFIDCGLSLYNEAILVTAVSSLPIRVGRQFSGGRKLGKTHQNVLVFYNGDPKAIKQEFPADVQVGEIEEAVLDGQA